MVATKTDFEKIIESFPTNVSHAFGYGSGVFSQEAEKQHLEQARNNYPPPASSNSNSNKNNVSTTTQENGDEELSMIDIIISTDDTKSWHTENLTKNPQHYSWIPRTMGIDFIQRVQSWGAGVYFNPMVNILAGSSETGRRRRTRLVKYGVISHERLKQDLKDWDDVYIAGRLHKPTYTIQACDEVLQLQEDYNLRYAMAVALLVLPQKQQYGYDQECIPVIDIFESIAGLSYMGDPRVSAGAEDPKKIQKLVHATGQLDRFQSMYKNQFQQLEKLGLLTLSGDIIQMNLMDISTRNTLYSRLPPKLQCELTDITSQAAAAELSHKNLQKSMAKIIAPSAKIQSVKGLVTAGLSKSIRYAAAKLAKGSLKGIIR